MKKFTVKAARKVAIYGRKHLQKGVNLSNKVENKATRILDGTDYSFRVDESIPLEKIYYNNLPEIIPLHPAMPAIGATPSVTLLIPTLDGNSFFGGTATALVVAAKLAQTKNYRLRIVQTLKTGVPKNLGGFFKSEDININVSDIQIISIADRSYNIYGYISMHKDDIFIASAWWDTHLIQQLPLTRKFVYLIQDFEPIFYNNSDKYVLAEETYKQDNFVALCNTKLMYDFMEKRNYPAFRNQNTCFYFEPAVSRIKSGRSIDNEAKGKKKRIFLYGRPNVHRNLFFTALESLDRAFKEGYLKHDEWELFMAGQDSIPDINLPARLKVKNLGKMSMQDYVDFSKTIDIAISPMMAPHPNYPTLEFASIGSAVVTTKYDNKQDLSRYSKNIFVSDTSVKSIAGAINLAAKTTYEDRLANLEKNNIPASWNESLDETISKILKNL